MPDPQQPDPAPDGTPPGQGYDAPPPGAAGYAPGYGSPYGQPAGQPYPPYDPSQPAYGTPGAPSGPAHGMPYPPPPMMMGPVPGQPVQTPYGVFVVGTKSKTTAGLLGIFLGGFGVGQFYRGNAGMGVAQLVVTLVTFGLGAWWGFIEGIIVLTA